MKLPSSRKHWIQLVVSFLSIGLIISYVSWLLRNDDPLGEMLVKAGYAQTQLSEPICFYDVLCEIGYAQGAGYGLENTEIWSLTYHPKGVTRGCRYQLVKVNGPFVANSWDYMLVYDQIKSDFGPEASPRESSDWGKYGLITIDAPTPDELWSFVNKYVSNPDPICEPN